LVIKVREGMMKKYLWVVPLVLLLFFVINCQDKAAMGEMEKYRAQAAVEEQNKALALRCVEAFQKGDVVALKDIFSPDYVGHLQDNTVPDNTTRTQTYEMALESCKNLSASYSDVAIIVEETIAKGDKVTIRYTAKGTYTGADLGLRDVRKKIEISGIAIERLENGKIVEVWDAPDGLRFFKQLGADLTLKFEEKKK
jgi:predicted ester cyclase